MGKQKWEAEWLEGNHRVWCRGRFALAHCLALALLMFLPKGTTTIAQAFLSFLGFSSKNLIPFFCYALYLLRGNVKIINKLRWTSLMFARFIDTCMAGTIQKPWHLAVYTPEM